MDNGPGGEELAPAAFCELCRASIAPGRAVNGQVKDSSFAHPVDPQQDGIRMVTACCADHLAELQRQYDERPFVTEELWVAKIDLAMQQRRMGLSNDQLVRETGLNLLQLEAAARWCLGVGASADDRSVEEA
ncbi:hypothetical protein [Streptomyces sp. NPDC101165]|uniref:hypothetical protein n=1 Tax=Streptomyces sp. NPDC101165 TaxID=3366119 RepID=UPI0037F899CD